MDRNRHDRLSQMFADNRPIILDGGLATELEAQGHDIGSALWSAALLSTRLDAIVAAHRAFLDAGAEIIISASYQASIEGFIAQGYSELEAGELIVRSVELACTARQQYCTANPETAHLPLVAASIGPYGAAMHDGSEYTGVYNVSANELRSFHRQRLVILERTNADLLACETIPTMLEAETLASLLRDSPLPAWVSFCCRDGLRISDGTPLREVCALFREHPRVLALGVNCTAPQHVASLIAEIKQAAPDKAVIVYPNSGETYHVETNSWSGDNGAEASADYAKRWRQAGATAIGGCCRIGPRHIAAIHDAIAT